MIKEKDIENLLENFGTRDSGLSLSFTRDEIHILIASIRTTMQSAEEALRDNRVGMTEARRSVGTKLVQIARTVDEKLSKSLGIAKYSGTIL